MSNTASSRPSGRILVDKTGTRERIDVDASKDADNSRAQNYDTAPGRAWNTRLRNKNGDKP
jgi:hypothetical protein